MPDKERNVLIETKGVWKRFPGVVALENIDFELRSGEVHVLLGENGAGKSTLIKILSGAYCMDEGKLFINGKETVLSNTQQAIHLGIATCYQEFNLIPYLTVAENIYLGRFPLKSGSPIPLINKKKMVREAENIIKTMDVDLNPLAIVNTLGVAQQQMVEIAKSLSMNAKIYIMDEPTAVLSNKELDELFKVINKLRDSGAGIIYISHRLEELPVIGDRVTVMRDGKKIGTTDIKGVSIENLIEMMVGRTLEQTFPKIDVPVGKELLRTESISRGNIFKDINIKLHAGEIVGIAGLVGSKRTEVVRAIFGADKISSGKIYIDSRCIRLSHPKVAVKNGISLLPEDRKQQGLVLIHSVKDNITLPSIKTYCRSKVINELKVQSKAKEYVEKLDIKTPSIMQKTKNLSGGNQQKVVIAKWLASGCKIFLFDEPTRGIDVGAKSEVYMLMMEIIRQGGGIIMVSSEMPEVVNMCNRVYVMHQGRICAHLVKEKISQENILRYALMGECPENQAQSF